MENVLDIILKDTYTLPNLKHRLRILKASLSQALFGGESSTFSPADLTWLKSLPENFYQNFNKDNAYQIFEALEKSINQIPTLVIFLPFEATDAVLSQIGSFARTTFEKPLLLDPKFDPALIAGAALSWKGVYRDYSVRARIEERKDEILEGFKKFLR